MSVELSYMAGPATAVLVVTSFSAVVAMWAVGVATLLAGLGLYLLNPATAGTEEPGATPASGRARVLGLRLVMVLVAVAGATFVLGGTDVGIVALLREADQLRWSGLVFIVWGAYSLTGGFVYGALPRPWSPLVLILLLGLCTIPLGVVGHWQWLCLLLLPAGLLCAPSLASSADAVSRLVPASKRGEAMGWYGSALTTGMSLGAPVVGFVVDRRGPAWAFVAAGAVGALVTLAAMLVLRSRTRADHTGVGTPQSSLAIVPVPIASE
jgi:predicted MFS family arabinose efflux permease